MRILIYGINFSPELTGVGKYSGELAAWLAERGHTVRVVTAPPYYPDWRVWSGYSSFRFRSEAIHVRPGGGRCDVVRCPLWVPARPGGLKRVLHLASFVATSLPVILRQALWRPHVVWVAEPTFFCAPVALFTARLCGAKSWLHVQDLEVDAAFEMGLVRARWAQRWVSWVEAGCKRCFDRVSTISARMAERLVLKRLRYVELFPNWVDTAKIFPLPRPSALRKRYGYSPEDVIALYSGNMGTKQGLDILADLARRCEFLAPSIKFVFCGAGPGKAGLQRACEGLSNVKFFDLLPAESLNELLNLGDIHLLPQRADAADLVMPSKLTGMLASGRPVVATASAGTQVAQVLQGRGLVVAPDDAGAMTEAVLILARDLGLRTALGFAARNYAVECLGKESILADFERRLESLVGQ